MFKFKNPQRPGAPLLKKYGYIEIGKFQPAVLHDNAAGGVKGYFCANCRWYVKKDGALYDAVCSKLKNAEISLWGCCNAWEYSTAPKVSKPNVAEPVEAPIAQSAGATQSTANQSVAPAKSTEVPTASMQKKNVPAEVPVEPKKEPVAQKPVPSQKPVPKVEPNVAQEPVPEEPSAEEEPVNSKRLKEVLRKTIKKVLVKALQESKRKK